MLFKRKTAIIIACLCLFHFLGFAQSGANAGMKFEHLSSWKEVLAKAKKEKKMIFLDCYTTWCGPCKMMSAKIFTQKEVGDFYNANFINTKIQLDTTDKDDSYVKGWHGDGHDIARKYNVNAYPTYLIFNSDGEIVHRFVGSMSADDFIAAGKNILDPDNQYYTQLGKYNSGDKSPQLLLKIADIASKAYDEKNEIKFTTEYLATQSQLYTKDNLGLLYKIARTSSDKGFQIAFNEAGKADRILGQAGASKEVVKRVLTEEEVGGLLRKKELPDFEAFDKKLKQKYPAYAKGLSDYAKMYYYRKTKKWPEFVKYADELVKSGDIKDAAQLNQFAWTAFEQVSDKALLEKAIRWSKASLKIEERATFMDTHANLLYKAGKTAAGLAEEKKALVLAKKAGEDTKDFEEVIKKMEQGEPTWPVE